MCFIAWEQWRGVNTVNSVKSMAEEIFELMRTEYVYYYISIYCSKKRTTNLQRNGA